MNIAELRHQEDLQRLKLFRYMDDDMNYEVLAKKARYFKQDKERVAIMCKIMEDMRNEVAKENARDTAERLIKKGKMTLEDIADCVPLLSFDELKEIEAEVIQLA